MSGNYHSAKTLNKGESEVGVTFSATRYESTTTDPNTGQTETGAVVLPNLIPEISYHIGMADDVEVGGRVGLGSLALEGDVKYRFYKSEKLHLAIAPAISYQSMIIIQGVGLRLPAILTYQLADNMDFTAAVFGSTTKYSNVDSSDSDNSLGTFGGSLVSTGGAVGFDLHGETFSIRPAIEFTRYVARLDDTDGSSDFSTFNFLVHIAWIGGKEKQQLNRIEKKIDALSAPAPMAPAPAPAPMAPAPAPAPAPMDPGPQ
ncbi:MAG: hypothetical protein IPL61_21565 [Myxococcales bacterium]|nr:hypothetical protein [Myxococcales bacterium]